MLLVCKKCSFIGHKLIREAHDGSDLKGSVKNLKRFERLSFMSSDLIFVVLR
jgi:hypothetical protein